MFGRGGVCGQKKSGGGQKGRGSQKQNKSRNKDTQENNFKFFKKQLDSEKGWV